MSQATAGGAALPPGPKGRRLYNVRQRLYCHSDFMDELHREYGDIAFFEIPARKCAAVFSADLIHEVLVEQEPYFQPYYPKTSYNLIPSPCLATSRFETHTELEKVMSGAFTPERMRAYGKAIIRNALTFRERLASNGSVDFKYEAERYTWGSLLDAVIGVDFKVEPELGKSVLDAMKSDMLLSLLPFGLALKRLPLPHNIRTARQIKALDEQTYRSIERARDRARPGENVISHFVRAADEGVVDWSFPDDSEIRDEAYTLMFGAVDAPTATLTHGIHFLARNPNARERLEQEVDDVLRGRPITLTDLDRLPYARAVFKETLRLEPPAYVLIPRETLEDRVVGGYLVPKGTLMNVCLRVMHRRRDYWDDANEFRPERWLEDAERGGSECPAHSYMPFSTKPRICQGQYFAEILFGSGLASLAQHLRLEPESEELPTKTNIGVGIMGTYRVAVTERP
ncbi:MAG: cytochrome P450 [Acidobacteria bacterium]|nr:cytochrome P450 [Acidobacteriota bacterium]